MVTGPLIAAALDTAPEIESKLKKLSGWGALNVPGNVERALRRDRMGRQNGMCIGIPFQPAVWQTQIAIVLPMDLTNNVPVTSALVRQLGKQRQYPIRSGRTMLCASHPARLLFLGCAGDGLSPTQNCIKP